MLKSKKKPDVSSEKIIQRFIEKKVVISADFNPCRLSKEIFIMITIYGSAALVILILFSTMNFFTSILIQERANIQNRLAGVKSAVYKPAGGDIIYTVDKIKYGLSEEINLSIINMSDKSIFLAPCQYFNKFEKKELNSWKEAVIDNCKEVTVVDSNDFEKISLKERQSILAVELGVGVWRGVSDIYMDCQKAEISACKSKKTVYSSEFKIETQKTEAPDVL